KAQQERVPAGLGVSSKIDRSFESVSRRACRRARARSLRFVDMDTSMRKKISISVSLLLALIVSRPAHAQFSIVGGWRPFLPEGQLERGPGPELGDSLGLPITDGARLHADSWDASRLTLREHQCKVHTVNYIYRGPLQTRFWEEKDPNTQQLIA